MVDRSFLDWPFFDDTHRHMATEFETWVNAEIGPRESEEGNVEQLTREFVAALGGAGWLRYTVPGDYGGAREKLDVRSICLIRETLSRRSGIADVAFAMQGLGTASITLAGSDELKGAYLPAVREGHRIAAFAMTEPDGGSDVAAMRTHADKHGNDYIINGTKTFISNAGIADHYVVFARTENSGAEGLSAFVVDADNPGLTVSERQHLLAPHAIGSLAFKDCQVPHTCLLGNPGDGFRIGMATLDIFRSTVGAAALGFARRALDEAVRYADEREVFDHTLADFQMVQDRIAQMAIDVDAAALLVYRSAWVRDTQAERVTREASMAKYYATEAAQRVADSALQIHGGHGVVSGSVIERLYREVRALRIYEGANDLQKLIIASRVLKDNRDAAGQKPALSYTRNKTSEG